MTHDCKKTPDLVKAVIGRASTVTDKEAVLAQCMECIPCLDVFREAVRERQKRIKSDEVQASVALVAEVNRAVKEDGFVLSAWQGMFIKDIGKQLAVGEKLDDKYTTILDKIVKKVRGVDA